MAADAPDAVRESCAWIVGEAERAGVSVVTVDEAALRAELDAHPSRYDPSRLPPSWAQDYHLFVEGDPDATLQYVLVLDALNFCFWPLDGYEYEHLAGSLKRVALADPKALSAERLAEATAESVAAWLRCEEGQEIPLAGERARLLREVGRGLLRDYGGRASALVAAAGGSACELVRLVTAAFPGFRDAAVYRGRQVFFYKRAQIFVGDVWGAFEGRGPGAFDDIGRLTCFADYRVPQLLHSLGVLRYAPELERAVRAREQLPSSSEAETQIRAATVHAVELMRAELARRGVAFHAVQLDWLLWEAGEASLGSLPPHHRTLTVFY